MVLVLEWQPPWQAGTVRVSGACELGPVAHHRRGELFLRVRDSATTSVQPAAVTRFLEPRLHELGYSILASMMAGNEYTDEIHDADVTFGLERILDGIDVLITQKRSTRQPRSSTDRTT